MGEKNENQPDPSKTANYGKKNENQLDKRKTANYGGEK